MVVIRATIASGCLDTNGERWSRSELARVASSFIGKSVELDFDHNKRVGTVVDAIYTTDGFIQAVMDIKEDLCREHGVNIFDIKFSGCFQVQYLPMSVGTSKDVSFEGYEAKVLEDKDEKK